MIKLTLELNIVIEQDNSDEFKVTLISKSIEGFRKEKRWVGRSYVSIENAFSGAFNSLYKDSL